jgi:hypothetical protein
MTHFYHFTGRALWSHSPFSDREVCEDAWRRLRERFDRCAASVLMPTHFHLVAETRNLVQARGALSSWIGAITKVWFPRKRIWEPLPPPNRIPDAHHLMRQIRYVHLNPCRDGLVPDPMQWEWSTHREALGAVAPVWMDMARIAAAWKKPLSRFPVELHRYVSGDPSVHPAGSPPPRPISSIVAPYSAIAQAAIMATRSSSGDHLRHGTLARRLAVHLARRIGAHKMEELAGFLGITPRAVFQIAACALTPAEEAALQAALRVLCEPRFFPQREK